MTWNKKFVWSSVGVLLVAGVFALGLWLGKKPTDEPSELIIDDGSGTVVREEDTTQALSERLQNATLPVPEYDDTVVTLVDGEGSFDTGAEQGTVEVLELYVQGLDSEGDDVLTFLVVNGSGSGIFYYLILLEDTGGAFVLRDHMFLGDRIGIDDVRVVPYADETYNVIVDMVVRAEGEPFVMEPTILAERMFTVSGTTLVASE